LITHAAKKFANLTVISSGFFFAFFFALGNLKISFKNPYLYLTDY